MVVRSIGPRRRTLSTHLRLLRRRRFPLINYHYRRVALAAPSISFPTLGTLSPQPYLDRVMKLVQCFDPKEKNIHLIYKAFRLAWEKHGGVERKNKLYPYIEHSLQVAELVKSVNGSVEGVAAALLHDTQEDTDITKGNLIERFGLKIAEMVDAVSKFESDLGSIELDSEELKVETIKKLIRYVVEQNNLSAIKIKLADRLVNSRDFETLFRENPENAKIKAEETLYVYVRLAKFLGMWSWSRELEDLAFEYVNPDAYRDIEQARSRIIEETGEKMTAFASVLRSKLLVTWISVPKVKMEERKIYEIYQRMQRWNIDLKGLDPTDIYRVNIIVAKEEDCFVMLGRLGKYYPPMQVGKEGTRWAFRDYISEPHPNGHRLLHVYAKKIPGPKTLLFQIRDEEMWKQYQFGIMADVEEKKIDLVEILGFLNSILLDLTKRDVNKLADVYRSLLREGARMPVYTPAGEVKYIPIGSTALDFVWHIHEELLLHLQSITINGKSASIFDRIPYRAAVKVFADTNVAPTPTLEWHDHAVSPHTQSALRSYYAVRDLGIIIADAKRKLQEEIDLAKYFIPIENLLDSAIFRRYLSALNIDVQQLLFEVGTARRNALEVTGSIREIYLKENLKAKGGPWEFTSNEFTVPQNLTTLVHKIYDNFNDLIDLDQVSANEEQVLLALLNNVLHCTDLYDRHKEGFSDHILPDDMLQLIDITRDYRGQAFDGFSFGMQNNIVHLNRLVLEHAYPQLCLAKPPGWMSIPYFIALNMLNRKGLINELTRGLRELGFNLYSFPLTEIEGKRITVVFAPEVYGEYTAVDQRVVGGGMLGQIQRIQIRTFAREFAGPHGNSQVLTLDEVIKHAEGQLEDLRYLKQWLTRSPEE